MNTEKANPLSFTVGNGPFRYLGLIQIKVGGHGGVQVWGSIPGVGAGTCDHCGTGIMDNYCFENADGEKFVLGSTCIAKTQLPAPIIDEAKREKRRLDREKRYAREKINYDAAVKERVAFLEQNEPALKALPHPSDYFAKQGRTYYDYVMYVAQGSSKTIKAYLKTAKGKLDEQARN